MMNYVKHQCIIELPHKKCYFKKILKVSVTHNNSYPEKLCKGGYYYESTGHQDQYTLLQLAGCMRSIATKTGRVTLPC